MATSSQELGGLKFSGPYGYDPDYGYGDSVSTDDDNKDEGLDEEIQLWDSFKCTEPPPKSGSMVEKRWYEVVLRVIKAILYVLLCLIILFGSVIAKAAILFAVSQISDRSIPFCNYYQGRNKREAHSYESKLPIEARIPWYWSIIFSFSIPEGLDFLRFLWNCFFVDLKLPKPQFLGLLTVIEILHSLGLALLFLVALPNLDVLQAAAALSCVCIVPVVLGIFSRSGNKQYIDKPRLNVIGDALALLGQIGGLISFTYLAFQREDSSGAWILPIALLLSSLRWWANYVSPESRFGFIKYLAQARRNLQAYRAVLIGYTSILRVLAFTLSALAIASWKGIEPALFIEGIHMEEYNYMVTVTQPVENGKDVIVATAEKMSITQDRWIPLYVMMIQAVAGVCIYNCAKFACRTLMQGFGFALPLNLAVPTTIMSLWIMLVARDWDVCAFHTGGAFDVFDYLFFFANDAKSYHANWYGWIWIIWAVSHGWITQHTWTTKNERLATTDKIFAVSSYDALLVDQSLAMSRWREEPEDDDYSENVILDVEEPMNNSKKLSAIKKQDSITKIYACATMWHETSEEMKDFLSSILRLDRDQCIMRILQKRYRIMSPDYYELEVHVFFDDAFKCIHNCSGRCLHDENKTQVNDFVVRFVEAVEKSIRDRHLRPSPPVKFPTPYGGQLLWTLPEKTKMYVHLKDKNRIRTRKRWSQVMYMYYLLGYRLMQLPIDIERKEVMAENTYILTLDGDIDFRPSAVRTLVDRMRINKDLGSVCGRIHPLGKGPLVWFQKFEYAIGHWLQKATEHTIGCVLCSPGCFALFRAKALMDFNVMRKYATVPTEGRHFIQYDQGEDRWLCTLILQMGYKVEYSAASDAYTHAPETFNEFFIQRRRWIPSTVANIFDLLETAKDTKKVNRDISWLYIFYQYILMGSTILGPGTIFLMLVGAFVAAFRIENWPSFGYNLIPIIIFCVVCYFCKEKTQLLFAGIITAIYGLVMIVVLVGIMIQISEDGWLAPTTLLFFLVAGELTITGLLHPLEWNCLVYGLIYYVTVPSMYLLLIIFSLFNMNNISWGTRDVPKPQVTAEEQQQQAESSNQTSKVATTPVKKEKGPIEFAIAGLFKCVLCAQEQPPENETQLKEISSIMTRIEGRLDEMERIVDGSARPSREPNQDRHRQESPDDTGNANSRSHLSGYTEELDEKSESDGSSDVDSEIDEVGSIGPASVQGSDRFLVSPNWLHSKDLGKGEVEYLKSEEEAFWKQFIGAYLDPIDKDEKREAEIAKQITQLRDQYVFKFFMVNALFVLIVFLMQLNKDKLHFQWPLGVKYNITYVKDSAIVVITKDYLHLEPIGCLFILGFCSVLLIQFIAMLFHRFDTFSHIMAKVSLDLYCCDKTSDLSEEAIIERHAGKITKELQRQIDSDPKLDGGHNSAIPPRKRKTIHQTMAGNERKQSYASTFSSALQRNLDESSRNGGGLTKRISQTTWQALHKRRTTVLQERRESQRQSQHSTDQPGNIYATADNLLNNRDTLQQRRPTGLPPRYAYENRAFVPEEFGIEESDMV